MTVPGIFLAAGEGKRFGNGKLLSIIDGEPLVVRSLRGPLDSSLEKVIVVLGFQAELVKEAVKNSFGDNQKVAFANNPGYREGMISTFNTGLAALSGGGPGAMMLLGDMPFVSGGIIDTLIRTWDGRSFLIPEVEGRMVHPRIVPRRLFQDFLDSESMNSGKKVLEKNRKRIRTVSFGNVPEFRDVDRKDDIFSF